MTEGEEAPAEENENGEEEDKAIVPEPEEDKTMSYEEYMASKARPDSAAFKPVVERSVENEFAGKVGAKKEEEDFLVMGGGKQPKKKGQKKDDKDKKLVLDFKVKSATGGDDRGGRRDGRGDRRGSGGRDGRRDGRRDRGRGGRGGRGGGGGRGLDATDPNAFPSLN